MQCCDGLFLSSVFGCLWDPGLLRSKPLLSVRTLVASSFKAEFDSAGQLTVLFTSFSLHSPPSVLTLLIYQSHRPKGHIAYNRGFYWNTTAHQTSIGEWGILFGHATREQHAQTKLGGR